MIRPQLLLPGPVFDPTPLDRCAQCGQPLPPDGPSPWFCAGRFTFPGLDPDGVWSPCQTLWYESATGATPADFGLVLLVADP